MTHIAQERSPVPEPLREKARGYVNLANRLRGQSKLDEAETNVRRALELDPELEDAHNVLGVVLWGQGRLEEAKASYGRALEIAPDHLAAHNNLGMVLKGLGNLEGAAQSFRDALRLDPSYARALYNLGNVLRDQGNLEAAAASYRRSLEVKPDYTKAHNALGAVQVALGKANEAAASFRRAAEPTVSKLSENNEHSISLLYAKNSESELARLCDLHGSDKGEIDSNGNPYPWPSHTYSDFYELIFGQRRTGIESVLECGIGTNNPNLVSSMGVDGRPGASLRVWRDYFRNAKVIGIDIDRDILFSEERIDTFEVDQTSPQSIHDFLEHLDSGMVFDIIIDDGLHVFRAGKTLFENLVGRLAGDGVYVIEDVGAPDLHMYDEYFSGLADKYYVRYICLHRPRRSFSDNTLVMITKKIAVPVGAVPRRPRGGQARFSAPRS